MKLTFATWVADLSARGHGVLAASHAVPIQLWLREPGDYGSVLHFLARGTTVTLRRYAATDLTTLVLRSECDCEEHRTAGAGSRTVLTPGAVPVDEVVLDGAALFGWTGFEAGLLDVPTAAELFAELRHELDGRAADVA
ncbi:hypothetical protein [Nocardioides iriomotensis]|uniref:Uncharacterized protein n=1 Tax=Nocardioides iriomotensis TaxID=715784 RepID=A0A4V1Z1S8_9ACTN|nr:hypothetical protein [Nocardioides iriomotensis]RYU11956.1 hypothetical protein ETU37_11910 [Nocardioides iriomotensis]